ncbi:MAG TPA: class I SAM-dependent methyltransferase [Bacteroidia bacterium]|nr:class I SAM-dependent methyltransferase [Bacteroidia bacterium]
MKDLFSADSRGYAAFRPGYPAALLDFVLANTPGRERAWDCGTGNGQLAAELVRYFDRVDGTDISASQLAEAPRIPSLHFSQQPAEKTDLPDGSIDLVTVAQAIHWFDFERFYEEVDRVAAFEARIAVIGYPLFSVNEAVDAVISHFYDKTIHEFWDPERRYLDEEYRTIPFPFEEIPSPKFQSTYEWDFDHLIGYLNTWSAVKNCIRQQGTNPLALIVHDLQSAWGAQEKHAVTFPMLLRLGKIG